MRRSLLFAFWFFPTHQLFFFPSLHPSRLEIREHLLPYVALQLHFRTPAVVPTCAVVCQFLSRHALPYFCHGSEESGITRRVRVQHEHSSSACEIQRCAAMPSWDLSARMDGRGSTPLSIRRETLSIETLHVHRSERHSHFMTLTWSLNRVAVAVLSTGSMTGIVRSTHVRRLLQSPPGAQLLLPGPAGSVQVRFGKHAQSEPDLS